MKENKTDEALKHIFKTYKKCVKAVNNEIREECREEALKILELADEKDRQDFLKYHKDNMGNVCCLVLDFAKKKLVEEGKLQQNENDYFKDPYLWLDDKSTNKNNKI